MESARAWRESRARSAGREMAEPRQPVRFHNEQPSAADVRDALQITSSANAPRSVNAAPRRPQILFVLATDETFEINTPSHVARLHEVQSRKGNCDCGGPALRRDSSFRGPYPIPPGITVACARVGTLFFCDQRVALRPQWIDLEYVRIAAIVRRIDDDLEVVVEFLADIPPELS